ncbi:MAG TPA: transcriptional regulator [Micromonosporaceae bacterium]|nr:transcriptional regulator [Micromonosporaceae bacterium]HCU48889.1 transcriptional regulator [Micromonosporaceae bacterium]
MTTTTAAQRRRQAKIEYDAFLTACPSRQLLDAISDKWVCLTLSTLSNGSQRYSDIARHIAGISQKMLTQTLRNLERDGLIKRTVTPSVPVRVDYELTPLGRSLMPVMGAVKEWAEAHMSKVLQARSTFDSTHNQ